MRNSYNFNGRNNNPQNYHYNMDSFTLSELETIEKKVIDIPFQNATILDNNKVDLEIRSSNIKWIPQNDEWYWLYEKLSNIISEGNNKQWNFHIDGIPEKIQYTEYYASEKGHYGWHQDLGPGTSSQRKISITVQLSSHEEYEGGVMEMWSGGKHLVAASKAKGSVFAFPSYMMHSVTPVTKGTRKSFVLWVGGNHYS